MRPFLRTFAMLVTLLALSGCNPFDHDFDSPDPLTMAYHPHVLVLRFRTINHAADTVGFVSVRSAFCSFESGRDSDSHLARSSATQGYFSNGFQFVYDDTFWHACTTEIEHFVGYQRRYGGDTTRLGVMDRYGEWTCRLSLNQAKAMLRDGDSTVVHARYLAAFPDTVRGSGALKVDLTVDLDGLLAWDSAASWYTMNPGRITITQR